MFAVTWLTHDTPLPGDRLGHRRSMQHWYTTHMGPHTNAPLSGDRLVDTGAPFEILALGKPFGIVAPSQPFGILAPSRPLLYARPHPRLRGEYRASPPRRRAWASPFTPPSTRDGPPCRWARPAAARGGRPAPPPRPPERDARRGPVAAAQAALLSGLSQSARRACLNGRFDILEAKL